MLWQRNSSLALFAIWLGSGNALLQELDLAVVVGFVFANMEPLAVIVRRAPSPGFVDGQEPVVIALAELRQCLLAGFTQQVHIVVEVMSLDLFARRLAKLHRYAPLFFVGSG